MRCGQVKLRWLTLAQFIFDLFQDLGAAVRGLPAAASALADAEAGRSDEGDGVATTSDSAAEGSPVPDSAAAGLDEATRTRRAGDVQDGQLTFYRLFRFDPLGAGARDASAATPSGQRPPMARRASAPDVSAAAVSGAPAAATGAPAVEGAAEPAAPGLIPCIVVGVRSLGATETGPPGLFTRNRPPHDAAAADGQQAGAAAAPAGPAQAGAPPSIGSDGLPQGPGLARYLLFISGGAYRGDHPLLSAPFNQAAQDLMLLMEVRASGGRLTAALTRATASLAHAGDAQGAADGHAGAD